MHSLHMKLIVCFSSLQQSLVSEYNPSPPPSFIRRRIARLLHRHVYPESRQVTDDHVDLSIDQKLRSLKEQHAACTDPVRMECLIRTRFDEVQALKMLRENPPNLVWFFPNN